MTGQVLTWISPFYGLYGRHVQVCPDFMEPCLDGELKLKDISGWEHFYFWHSGCF